MMGDMLIRRSAAFACLALAAPVCAATPDSYAKLDKASATACAKASGLRGPSVGPAMRYSDNMLIDARVVEGTWPQPHMNNAKARMLCLYHRRSKRVEVQEMSIAMTVPTAEIKDIWWRAEDVGGRGVIDRSEVTLMLGSDGKIGGKSGCNGYSANYQITGDALKVYPPMIGTRMACPPALMTQEDRYRSLIETAKSVRTTPEGWLVITSVDGTTSRFSRKQAAN